MTETSEIFQITLKEYFEFCAELMDIGYDENFTEHDGSAIRDAISLLPLFSGLIMDKFIGADDFWIDAYRRDLSFFEKDFSQLLSGTSIDLNVIKTPILKYIDFKNGKIHSCPFNDDDVKFMWDYLSALIKHATRHVEKNVTLYPSFPLSKVKSLFEI